jgi:hypothetical protein
MNSRDFLSVHNYSLSVCLPQVIQKMSHLVLVVWVQVQTALLRSLPVLRYALVDICLVDDLGDQLRSVVDCARVWRWEFAAEDSIFTACGDKQTKKSPYAVYCESKDQNRHQNEYRDATAHGGRYR